MLDGEDVRVLEAARGATVAVDDAGRIEYASPEALTLVGWDATLVGRPLTTIIPERLQPRHRAGFERYVESGRSRLQGSTVRVPALRRDGSERELDLTIRVFRRPDGTKLVAAALAEPALGRPPPHLVVLEDALARRLYELV